MQCSEFYIDADNNLKTFLKFDNLMKISEKRYNMRKYT